MAVVRVREDRVGQKGMGDDRTRDYTRTFTVECSSPLDDSLVVRVAPGIPRVYAPYVSAGGTYDLRSWCRSVSAERVADSNVWRVTAQYSSRIDAASPGGGAGANSRPDVQSQPNPVLRPPVIEWDTVTASVPATYDRDGNAIVNSAGDPFDPPLEVEEARLYLRVTKNQLSYDATKYLSYHDTVNSKKFIVFRPNEVRCRKIKGTNRWENGVYFWECVFEFEVRRENVPTGARRITSLPSGPPQHSQGQTRWVLDRGYREKVNGVSKNTTSVNGTDNYATFNDDPKWTTGEAVTVDDTIGGLTAGTTYYVRSLGSGNYSFHTSVADAVADRSRVDLDGTDIGAVTSKSRLKHILDPFTKQPVSSAAMLDGGGGAAVVGATPRFLGFETYKLKDFNKLRIF